MSTDDEVGASEPQGPQRKLLSFKGKDGGDERWLKLMRACLQTAVVHDPTGKSYKIYSADGRGGKGKCKTPTKMDLAQRIATILNGTEKDAFHQQLTAKTVDRQWTVSCVSCCADLVRAVFAGHEGLGDETESKLRHGRLLCRTARAHHEC